jgi:predicted alpha/beta hydrolase family esterase
VVRTSDVDLLIVPGWDDSDPDHWQSRWATKLSTARRIAMPDFARPDCAAWVDALIGAAAAATRPAVFIGHSCGALAIAHAAPRLASLNVIGAMLVAPPAPLKGAAVEAFVAASDGRCAAPVGFHPAPDRSLPLPTMLIASRNDPFCPFKQSEGYASDWGAHLVDAGDAGHINSEAGFGPWPDGAMKLAAFLRSLATHH